MSPRAFLCSVQVMQRNKPNSAFRIPNYPNLPA